MHINVRQATQQSGSEDGVHVSFTLWGTESDELRAIMSNFLPAWAELFARKNGEYQGGGGAFRLGIRGQYSDMYRKMMKLELAMWDGHEELLATEGVDEILMDMIGHCFLTLAMRNNVVFQLDEGVKEAAGPQVALPLEFQKTDPRLTPERRAELEKKTGLHFNIPPDGPQQITINNFTQTAELDGKEEGDDESIGSVDDFVRGDEVTYKQHLGQGDVYVVSGFRDREGVGVIQVRKWSPPGADLLPASWAKAEWLVPWCEFPESATEHLSNASAAHLLKFHPAAGK